MPETFGDLLRDRLTVLGIGRGELVQLLRVAGAPVHPNMIARWCSGEARPTGARLNALLDVLQLKLREERAEACLLAARVSVGSSK